MGSARIGGGWLFAGVGSYLSRRRRRRASSRAPAATAAAARRGSAAASAASPVWASLVPEMGLAFGFSEPSPSVRASFSAVTFSSPGG